MGDWTQTIATIASVIGVGIALLAYLTRQFNRIETGQQALRGDVRTLQNDVQNVENEQARMLGFLESRGVMGRAIASKYNSPQRHRGHRDSEILWLHSHNLRTKVCEHQRKYLAQNPKLNCNFTF